MKIRRIVSAAAAVISAAVLTVSASAYTINKDLGFGWTASVIVPGEEFESATVDSTITITFETNPDLADLPGNDYWCIKPMINDAGWPFVDNLIGPALSDGGDSYPVAVEDTSISFKIPAEELEHIQEAGLAFMGHGVNLLEMTISNDAPAAAEAPAVSEAPAETTAPAAGDTAAATDSSKGSPDTGIEDVAVFGGIGLVAAAALILSAKRRS